MKSIFILLVFFGTLSLAASSSHAQTAAMDSLTMDTTGASSSGGSTYSNAVTNLVLDITDWITGTVWDALKSVVTDYISSGVQSGLSSIGGTIESWGDDVASWFSTRRARPGGYTILANTSDTSVVFSDGMGTKGILIGGSLGLLAKANGGTIVVDSNLGQNTTYTIPDPGSATAKFVLDQGDQTLGGKRSFTGTVNISSLTKNSAVVTDANDNLTSLGYGSGNTASTLVERDGSGNFSAGTVTASNVSTQTLSYSVTTASVSSNATTLDNSHTYFIIPSNGGTAVSITAPANASGKVIIIENQDASAATTGLVVPAGATYSFIYNGTAWKHAS